MPPSVIPAVEQAITYAATDNNAKHAVEQKVINLFGVDGRMGCCATPARKPPGKQEGDDIHQAVPTNFEGSDPKNDGIYLGENQHEYLRCRKLSCIISNHEQPT